MVVEKTVVCVKGRATVGSVCFSFKHFFLQDNVVDE